jgi:hypothetical protein
VVRAALCSLRSIAGRASQAVLAAGRRCALPSLVPTAIGRCSAELDMAEAIRTSEAAQAKFALTMAERQVTHSALGALGALLSCSSGAPLVGSVGQRSRPADRQCCSPLRHTCTRACTSARARARHSRSRRVCRARVHWQRDELDEKCNQLSHKLASDTVTQAPFSSSFLPARRRHHEPPHAACDCCEWSSWRCAIARPFVLRVHRFPRRISRRHAPHIGSCAPLVLPRVACVPSAGQCRSSVLTLGVSGPLAAVRPQECPVQEHVSARMRRPSACGSCRASYCARYRRTGVCAARAQAPHHLKHPPKKSGACHPLPPLPACTLG